MEANWDVILCFQCPIQKIQLHTWLNKHYIQLVLSIRSTHAWKDITVRTSQWQYSDFVIQGGKTEQLPLAKELGTATNHRSELTPPESPWSLALQFTHSRSSYCCENSPISERPGDSAYTDGVRHTTKCPSYRRSSTAWHQQTPWCVTALTLRPKDCDIIIKNNS